MSYRTENVNGLFSSIARLARIIDDKTNGLPHKNPNLSALVVPKGLISNKIISFFKNLYMNLRGSVDERVKYKNDF